MYSLKWERYQLNEKRNQIPWNVKIGYLEWRGELAKLKELPESTVTRVSSSSLVAESDSSSGNGGEWSFERSDLRHAEVLRGFASKMCANWRWLQKEALVSSEGSPTISETRRHVHNWNRKTDPTNQFTTQRVASRTCNRLLIRASANDG